MLAILVRGGQYPTLNNGTAGTGTGYHELRTAAMGLGMPDMM